MKSIILSLIIPFFHCQECRQELMIDDFSTIRAGWLDNLPKTFNALGGDYGSLGAPFTIDTAIKTMKIQARTYPVGVPEAQANPGTVPTFNYWYVKFDEAACFDASVYSGISFDMIAPLGSDMNFTMTQQSLNCSYRLVDSQYQLLSKYITPDGTKQTVFLPFSDFSTNLYGNAFDFRHLKDWTLVNLGPEGSVFEMSDLKLIKSLECNNDKNQSKTSHALKLEIMSSIWMTILFKMI